MLWGARFWPAYLAVMAVIGITAEIVALATNARNSLFT